MKYYEICIANHIRPYDEHSIFIYANREPTYDEVFDYFASEFTEYNCDTINDIIPFCSLDFFDDETKGYIKTYHFPENP